MKILLIQPPIRDFYHTRHRMYPLGLLYLASSLRQAGFSCEILDACSVEKKKALPIPAPLQYLKAFYPPEDKSPFRLFGRFYHFGLEDGRICEQIQRADMVGISSLFTPYEEEALRVARLAKGQGKLVVMGGNHATATAERLLEDPAVDYIICGEGEHRLVALCEALQGRRDLESLDGLAYRVNNRGRIIPPKALISDLDSLPFPERSLLNPDRYLYRGRRSTMILASRGCPYRCRFCSGHVIMGREVRYRSIDNLVAEMRLCRDLYQIEVFNFEDENFTFDKNRAIRLLEAIEEEFKGDQALRLQFENGLLPRSLDAGILKRMKRLGCHHINLPMVSSSIKILRELKRPGTSRSLARVVSRARGEFFITAYLILGLPQSDLEDMIRSIRFLSNQQVLIAPSIFYATPGMELYEEVKRKGWLSSESSLPLRSSAFPIETDHFQRLDLVTLFRLVRMVNFIKSLIDESDLKGELELSTFLKTELGRCPVEDHVLNVPEIIVSRPLSQKELGLGLLSRWLMNEPPFYQIHRERRVQTGWLYRFIHQAYSERVWKIFQARMSRSLIRGVRKADFSVAWDLAPTGVHLNFPSGSIIS